MARPSITVLIVDDSSMVRALIRRQLEREPDISVVGEAIDGRDAIELACRLRPQVITMDLEMPALHGLDAIEQIMALAPTRILVVTAKPSHRQRQATFEALARGALDLILKPPSWRDPDPELSLARRIRELATIPVVPHVRALRDQRRAARDTGPKSATSLVVVGASTGGPRVVKSLLAELPASFAAPILVLQHLADPFGDGFVEWLAEGASLEVREAKERSTLRAGCVDVVVRGPHVVVDARGKLSLFDGPPREGHRPSIDVMFESVAKSYGAQAIGVLLTGMGRDGAEGLGAIHRAGGVTLAQDEASCVVFGMPRAAIEMNAVRHIVSAQDLPLMLKKIV
jgi:two-component system, chemotaxis family, protein-glutamate methylesterase/glutaminase